LAIKKGYRPTLEMFDLWQSAFEAPAKYHEIKRGSMLIMPHDEYQRKGLTDLKWKQMQMPENMIGDEVLDLGCNAGWIGRYCLERGAAEVEGIDINWRYYDEAIVAGYSRVFLGDMNDQVWFENATRRIYDRVFCLAMLHYIQNKPDFIKRLALITKGGSGECVIEMPIAQGEAEAVEKYNGCDIPTMPLMMHWLNDAFSEVEVVGRSIAPDGQLSTRYIFKCRHVAKINVKGK
jgi:SAM-dependent methyltransferase